VSEYWFNTATRQVEEGHQSDWKNLMGPYPTRDAAERALETARANTERWDAQDKKDSEWQDPSWTDGSS
jgi:hypothetical protein